MTKTMLINTIDQEESRMAIVEDGMLTEFNIRMSVREPTVGNIYKGVVQKVEPGLRAAFVEYGAKKSGFLPLNDVSAEYLTGENDKLPAGKEVLVKVVREERGNKGAMLTTYVSLPGRYLVLMPNRKSVGISRKIDDDGDRKRLKELMTQISQEDDVGYIIRTAGINRTKQELIRDYQMVFRLWKNLKKKAEKAPVPSLIYEESDFGIRAFRDYYTADIDEILVDNQDTYKKMRDYCKAVSPRSVRMIKMYRDEIPLFDKYGIEDQISIIYGDRVGLKSGGYLIINPTEAMITIDVNSGRGSNKRDVEETAFRTNLEAAAEIARQLRLRDLGGLIVIDFIDMKDRKHNSEIEKTFKNALSLDRSRIQLSKISRFGILELSRQKKQSTIQEISYVTCPHCKGSGMSPSVEYMALSTFRRIKSKAAGGDSATIKITVPYEVSSYLLNQKRAELSELENLYDMEIFITGSAHMESGKTEIEVLKKKTEPEEGVIDAGEPVKMEEMPAEKTQKKASVGEPVKRRRRPRRRRPSAASAAGKEKNGIPDVSDKAESAAKKGTEPVRAPEKKDATPVVSTKVPAKPVVSKEAQDAKPVKSPVAVRREHGNDRQENKKDAKATKAIVNKIYKFFKT